MDWLRDSPELQHRTVRGSLGFADISGFTQLTERLARRGKAGAEEIGDVINTTFEQLLAAAYDYGAGLVKWGGDAVLLLFDGDDHMCRSARAMVEMQRVMRRIGRVSTSMGSVTLRISVGLHTGEFDFFLVGDHHRELVVAGPQATTVAQLESVASPGQIVVSDAVAQALRGDGAARMRRTQDGVLELIVPPAAPLLPNRAAKTGLGESLARALCPMLVEHVVSGAVDAEHRQITAGFLVFSGVDALREHAGSEACRHELAALISRVQARAEEHGVAFLGTDVAADGGKIILAAGAPRNTGDDEARMLGTLCGVVDHEGGLPLRAGVASGRAFAADFGPSYRRVYSITGDCVNLAARLASAAAAGQVLATRAVTDASRTPFNTEPVPPLALKGKAAPVAAQAVRSAPHRAATVRPDDLPLTGRDAELAVLLEAAASVTRTGAVLVLSGEAGMGKSRLVRELASCVSEDLIWVHGDIYATSTPYMPICRLIQERLHVEDGADPTAVARLLEAFVERRAPHLSQWLPLLAIVAGADIALTEAIESIPQASRRAQMERATEELLAALLPGPAIVVLDDVHLMDEATADVIRRLAAGARERRWLMLITRRTGACAWLDLVDGVRDLPLQPLDATAAHDLLTAVTESQPLAPHAQSALARRAGGNPLFLYELAAMAREAGSLGSVPESIEGVIASRIDRLFAPERRWLRTAAVLGMTVDPGVLASMLEPDSGDHDSVDTSRLADFIAVSDDGAVAFRHHLVQHVAYEGLPYRRRVVLHGRAGDAIEQRTRGTEGVADLLSLHFFAAERFHSAWLHSRVAGDRARVAYAYTDAVEFYERAILSLAHLDGVPAEEQSAVNEAFADSLYELGEFFRAAVALRAARTRAGADPVRMAWLQLKTALICERSGELVRALRWIDRGRRALQSLSGPEQQRVAARLEARRARILYLQGNPEAAGRWARRAIACAELCDDRETLARALLILDHTDAATGRLERESNGVRALRIFTEIGDLIGQALTHNDLGVRAFYEGNWRAAVAHYADAEESFLGAGTAWDAAQSSANIAEIMVYQGRLAEAESRLQRAVRVGRAAGALPEVTFATSQLARIAALSGRDAEAMSLLESVGAYYRAHNQRLEISTACALTAEAHLVAGRNAVAADTAERALAELEGFAGLAPAVPMLLRIRGLALARTHRRDAARQALHQSLAAARARKAVHEVALTLDAMLEVGGLAGEEGEMARLERDGLFHALGMRRGWEDATTRHEPALAAP